MRSFFAILWLFCAAQTIAQPSDESTAGKVYNVSTIEVRPEFPGGLPAFYEYIGSNYRVPSSLKTEGRVLVSFVVERDGTLGEIKVLRDLGDETAAEAIRVLNASPKWTPATQNGVAVRCIFTLPLDLKPYPDPRKNKKNGR